MSTSTLTPSGRLAFACPNCDRKMKARTSSAGKRKRCRKCEEPYRIPFPPEGELDEDVAELEDEAPVAAKVTVKQRIPRKPLKKAPRRSSLAKRGGKREAPSTAKGTPYAPPESRLESRPKRSRLGRRDSEGKRDLHNEAHVRAIGIWNVLGGILVLGFTAFIYLSLPAYATIPLQGVITLAILCVIGSGNIFTGVGLCMYQGWARVATIILTALSIVANVYQVIEAPATQASKFGTVVGILWAIAILITLSSANVARICTADYRAKAQRSSATVAFWASPFFYIPLVLIGCAIALVLFAMLLSSM